MKTHTKRMIVIGVAIAMLVTAIGGSLATALRHHVSAVNAASSETTTLTAANLPTTYTSTTIKNSEGYEFTLSQVANYGQGMQFKASGAYLYNAKGFESIISVKGYDQTGKSSSGLTVGFGNSINEAEKATGTQISKDGVSGDGKSYFYIKNTSGSARYLSTLIVEFDDSFIGDRELDYITVSGMTTRFVSGSEFYFDGICLAFFTDGSSKEVTPTNFSIPNMYTFGTQQVTVYYTYNNVTKSTNFDIDIIENTGSELDNDFGDYYVSISNSLIEDDLLRELRELNLRKRASAVGYSAMGTGTSGMFKYTDYDPTTVVYDSKGQPYGTKILSFYSGKPATSFNREHVWPNSRGGGSKGNAGSPYVDQDIYMPRPTITAENSDRGNSKYVEGKKHSSNGWDPVEAFADTIGVYDNIRGECARIIFYCMTVNSRLQLDDTDTGGTTGVTMGKISDLLKWNLRYPVNDREIRRQSGGQYLQGNRNAFVDHPEYACKIWGNYNAATKAICGDITQQNPPVTEKKLSSLTISGKAKNVYVEGEQFDPTGLTVTANFTDKTSLNVTSSVSWAPRTLSLGVSYVTTTYAYEGITKSATYAVTVNPKTIPVTSVSLNKTSIETIPGVTATLIPTVLPVDASNKEVTWSSSNNDVATVNNGIVSAIGEGECDITVQTVDGNKTATCHIVVKKLDEKVEMVDFDIVSSTDNMEIGETRQIELNVSPSNASNQNFTYETSNRRILQVSNTGLLKANTSGEATITITSVDNPSLTKEITITVNEATPTEVVFAESFNDYLENIDIQEVTITDWFILEEDFNGLDEASKEIFRTIKYTNSPVKRAMSTIDSEIIDCVKKYDAIYLEHDDEGFNDFMGRFVDAPENHLSNALYIGIIGGVAIIVVSVTLVLIITTVKRKKHENE